MLPQLSCLHVGSFRRRQRWVPSVMMSLSGAIFLSQGQLCAFQVASGGSLAQPWNKSKTAAETSAFMEMLPLCSKGHSCDHLHIRNGQWHFGVTGLAEAELVLCGQSLRSGVHS